MRDHLNYHPFNQKEKRARESLPDPCKKHTLTHQYWVARFRKVSSSTASSDQEVAVENEKKYFEFVGLLSNSIRVGLEDQCLS